VPLLLLPGNHDQVTAVTVTDTCMKKHITLHLCLHAARGMLVGVEALQLDDDV
jgi:hypothetical protein